MLFGETLSKNFCSAKLAHLYRIVEESGFKKVQYCTLKLY